MTLAAISVRLFKVWQPVSADMTRRNHDFLPAALEILETPPAPLPIALMLSLCAFFVVALVWSIVGQLDINVIAPGKLEVAGRAKIIQPLEQGKIAAIAVGNGAHVKAGDLLIELDPSDATADEHSARTTLQASLAEVTRRRFSISVATTVERDLVAAIAAAAKAGALADVTDAPGDTRALGVSAQSNTAALMPTLGSMVTDHPVWDAFIPEPVRLREEGVLRADLAEIGDSLSAFDKQILQKRATSQRLAMSIEYQKSLIDTLYRRVLTRQDALSRDVGTKISLYDANAEMRRSQSALASDQGQLLETDAAVDELQSEKVKALSRFIADNENKLADAARKAEEARDALSKAAVRLAQKKLYAPIDGSVQQVAVTTIGQVVSAGQQLAIVVPSDQPLQVEALVANIDVGFVRVGQEVAVKLDAFPFNRFGTVRGRIRQISSEAVDEQDAKRSLANATSPMNGGNVSSVPGQPTSFVFPVEIAIDRSEMIAEGAAIPLTPGMTVTVDIRTGRRRIIDYLLSPLSRTAAEAMRER